MTSAPRRAVGFIFARGGSKGVPGKNIRQLGGKPLIAYSIETARACPLLETVVVSTDDDRIAMVSESHGAEVPFRRPGALATDEAPEWLSWQHAVRWFTEHRGPFHEFVILPTTSPFRSVEDVTSAILMLRDHPDTDIVVSVRAAERSPYFNMVKFDEQGLARRVIEPERAITRRQDAPVVFDMTTVVYVARPDFILQAAGLFEGRVRAVTIPGERAMDIDTPHDFMIAECIAAHRSTANGTSGEDAS